MKLLRHYCTMYRVWARIWLLRVNLSLKVIFWGTFSISEGRLSTEKICTFLSLLSSATSFPLICSPSVELSSVSFCKASAREELRVEAKNYLVFEHAFVMVPTFFERNLHCVLCGIMLEWACHMSTRAWREHKML